MSIEKDLPPVEGEVVSDVAVEKAVRTFTQHGGEEWVPSTRPLEAWMCGSPRQADGQPCRRAAVAGGVCLKHGAQLPAVREAHKRKLAALLPKARKRLSGLLDSPEGFVQLGAIKELHRVVVDGDAAKGPAGAGGVNVNIGFLGTPPANVVIKKDE